MVKNITKTVNGTPRQIGIQAELKVKKNRLTGRVVKVQAPIYWGYGIDDIAGCIDFLVTEKHWTEVKGNLKAAEFEFEGKRRGLIEHIEENDLEQNLYAVVADVWAAIERALVLPRKKRYE